MNIDNDTSQILRALAHHMAADQTRAVQRRDSLVVFQETVADPDSVAVAEINAQFAVGQVTHPRQGWIQVGDSVYPADRCKIRGPVLFVVTAC